MNDVERFRDVIVARAGARVRDDELESLGSLLEERMRLLGFATFDEYSIALDHPDELALIVHRIVAGETYFFRCPAQFHALATIFEEWKRRGRSVPRILSAGCATGEEAYSIAIVLQRYWEIASATVIGVDIDPARLAAAEAARYSSWSLRALDPVVRASHFRRVGRRYEVSESVRSSVRFHRWNLMRPLTSLGQFDVIFCRNVMIYFGAREASELAMRLSGAVVRDGFLFTSHAESVGIPGWKARRFDDAFVYTRATVPCATPDSVHSFVVDVVSQRTRAARPTAAAPDTHEELKSLLRRERYREALSVLDSQQELTLSQEEMRAALLFATGSLREASELAARLRSVSPIGNFVAGLCAEAQGDVATAEIEYRLAARTPFAFAHMRLGLLLAADEPESARRHLRSACELMDGASDTMVLLFGGGFGVDALRALCLSRLQRLEQVHA